MKNVTISQAEYDAFLAQKAQIQKMQVQLDALLEQLRLARHKTMLKYSAADDKLLYEHIKLSGCWAHARRYFHDALKAQGKKKHKNSLAYQGLQRCDALFGIEGHMKDFSVEERYKIRQTKSKPLVDEYFTWLRWNHYILLFF